MRTRMWLPVSIFLAGVALIALAVATGKAEVSLVVVFPVFTGTGGLFLLGILLIILSFFVGFGLLATASEDYDVTSQTIAPQNLPQQQQRSTKYGGFLLIGPIPIAFGSDKKLATIMLIIGIVLAVVLVGALIAFA